MTNRICSPKRRVTGLFGTETHRPDTVSGTETESGTSHSAFGAPTSSSGPIHLLPQWVGASSAPLGLQQPEGHTGLWGSLEGADPLLCLWVQLPSQTQVLVSSRSPLKHLVGGSAA